MMKTLFVLIILGSSICFGQCAGPTYQQLPGGGGYATSSFCGLIDGYARGLQLRMQREQAQAQKNLMDAQAAAVRAETERLRLETERMKQSAVPTPAPAAQTAPFSPGAALIGVAEFRELPMAVQIRLIRAVEPELSAQHTDADFEKALSGKP
jgi:hypothetical protein